MLHVQTDWSAILNSNLGGMPWVVWTSRQAPVSERLRMVQGRWTAPSRIFPDLSIRKRNECLRSFIMRALCAGVVLVGTAYSIRNASTRCGTRRTPGRTCPGSWGRARSISIRCADLNVPACELRSRYAHALPDGPAACGPPWSSATSPERMRCKTAASLDDPFWNICLRPGAAGVNFCSAGFPESRPTDASGIRRQLSPATDIASDRLW